MKYLLGTEMVPCAIYKEKRKKAKVAIQEVKEKSWKELGNKMTENYRKIILWYIKTA